MASQSGGFGIGIPGLASDGAGGIIVSGAITAGDPNAALVPTFHTFHGSAEFRDTPGNMVDFDSPLNVTQQAAVLPSGAPAALFIDRIGALGGNTYTQAALTVNSEAGAGVEALGGGPGANLSGDVRANGHLIGGAVAPTPTAGAGLGTGPPAVDLSGSDVAGILSLGTGTSPTANAGLVTVAFASAYASAPAVILEEVGASLVGLTGLVYVSSTDVNSFTVAFTGTLAASRPVGTYQIAYHVIGTS